MIDDDFEHQRAHFVAMANQAKQQAVSFVKLGAVKLAVAETGELLDLGSTEVIARNGFTHLAVAGRDARSVEVSVFEDFHRTY